MIVRISGEGQFRLPDEDADRLNELDNRAVAAVEQGDETGFRELWSPDARAGGAATATRSPTTSWSSPT